MQEKIRLNTKLISSLESVLYMSKVKMGQMSSIPCVTWYRIMNTPDAITIQKLLAIANGLHIPIRRFFLFGEIDEIGRREDYIVDNYQPCHYDANALKSVVDNRTDITWKKAARVTGISYQNLQRSLLAETRLPVTRLLTVCEAFEINPFEVIIDPNPPYADQRKNENTIATSGEYENIREGIVSMKREIAKLKTLLAETKRDIAELGKKLDAVADDNEIQPIAWRARRVASQAAKMAK